MGAKCPYCGSYKTEKLSEGPGYEVWKCKECGLGFIVFKIKKKSMFGREYYESHKMKLARLPRWLRERAFASWRAYKAIGWEPPWHITEDGVVIYPVKFQILRKIEDNYECWYIGYRKKPIWKLGCREVKGVEAKGIHKVPGRDLETRLLRNSERSVPATTWKKQQA